jgi:hypothetical protein
MPSRFVHFGMERVRHAVGFVDECHWFLQKQVEMQKMQTVTLRAMCDAATQLDLTPGKQYGMQTVPELRREAYSRCFRIVE